MRRIRRKLLCLISPRQYTLIKLVLVILFSTVWLLSSRELQVHNNLNVIKIDQSKSEIVTPSVEEVSKITENQIILRTVSHFLTSSTFQEHKKSYPIISRISKTVLASTVFTEEVEKSRSRLRISQNGVLSPRAVRIRPPKPIVKEGSSLFLTCGVFDASAHHKNDAPYLNFELPEMSDSLQDQIFLSFITNMAVLKVEEVQKGHEGTYKCVSQNFANEIKYNTVEVRVVERATEDTVKDDKIKRKHETYLTRESHESNTAVASLLQQGKVQQKLVEEFCDRHNLSQQALQLPVFEENTTNNCLYRHLLLNDKTGTLFCFVPKVGCTNLKLLFFVAIGLRTVEPLYNDRSPMRSKIFGIVPRSQLAASRDEVDQEMLEGAQFANSFLSRSDTQRNFALKNYFKFMIYRNPLERLLSGYRSKVERFPLTGLEDDKPHYNWLRKAICENIHPAKYQKYLQSGGAPPVNISFSDFIDYWLTRPESLKNDEHFRSIFSICEPCRTRYNFYGNFKNFNTDSQVLIKKIHTTARFLRSGYYQKDSSTGTRTQKYFRQLSRTQITNIVELLKLDLDFYYHLFPDEANIDKLLIGAV